MNRTVLVTGGAGYIGSHTCKLLKQNGYTPVTYDNLIYGHRSFVKWGPFIEGDIFDQEKLAKVFAEYNPGAVIHFAAFAYVGESVAEPGKYYRNNVAGTVSLLEAMRAAGCNNIVFSSTCAVYGVPDKLPIRESYPTDPINPYGRSKLMVERILSDYETAHGLKYIALRYFNAAGADLDGEIGEDHTPEPHLIPSIIFSAMKKRPAIEVYGTDYPTGDGTAVRDYIYVNDLADGHIRALQFLEAEKSSRIFNLGTGRGNSVKEIIDVVSRVSGLEVPVVYKERRPGDPPTLVATAELAAKELGWKPRFTDIDSIISSAWKWHAACCGD